MKCHFRSLVSILIIICTYSLTQAQKKRISIIKEANYYFNEDDFEKALKNYLIALEYDSLNANLQYKIGLCYLNLPEIKDNFSAIPYFQKATKNTAKKYHYNSNRERKAPADVWYNLADIYKLMFDFENADKCYETYLNLSSKKQKIEKEYVIQEKKKLNTARLLIQYPKELQKDSLKINIESVGGIQSCPVLSKDGTILVFCLGNNNIFPPDFKIPVSNSDYKMDKVFLSRKVEGIWQKPINIMKSLHATELTIPTSISSDGKTLYLVRDDNDNGNIYESHFNNGTFGKMKKIGKKINSRYWESHASITEDGKLFFTSDRPGGFGGLDIYVSSKNSKGKWEEPVNIGNTVNTELDEETPFIVDNGNTLYFSSKGHYNMGGFDIFCSVKKDSVWLKPLNLGYPLNTVGNDLVYLPKLDSLFAYAPLNRYALHDPKGKDNDLYFRQIPNKQNFSEFSIKGQISSTLKQLNYDEIKSLSIEDSSEIGIANPVNIAFEKENYLINIPSGFHKLTFYLKNHQPITKYFDLPPVYGYNLVNFNIEFKSDTGLVAIMNDSMIKTDSIDANVTKTQIEQWKPKNILFGFDKSTPLLLSNELDSIAAYMKQNTGVKVTLTGYADSVGDAEYNLLLSKQRALYVKNKLISMGIDKNSITINWKGEENPVSTNNTQKGRALNRRVEVVFN